MSRVHHGFGPVYDETSKILILGSMPSVKSREMGFYYMHPQNRFWRVLSALLQQPLPETAEQRRAFALRNHIALWDVVESCDIVGSSDASIKRPIPNDIPRLLEETPVAAVYTNGKTADKLYNKFIFPETKLRAECLPSTSPANAQWNLSRLTTAWTTIILGLTTIDKKKIGSLVETDNMQNI